MNSMKPASSNLLNWVPFPLVEWETGPEDAVILHIPKFRQKHMAKWFLPLLAKPAMRVHLDRIGSAVWKMFNGTNSVQDICRQAWADFGGDETDWSDRVIRFVRRLEKEQFIRLDVPGNP
jgi:hypothetical protein